MEVCNKKYTLKEDLASEIDSLTDSKDCSSKHALNGLKNVTKTIYEHLHKDNSLTELKTKSYRRLLVDGFDSEQIFQQIELQNKSALEHINNSIKSINDSNYVRTVNNNHTSENEECILEKSYNDSDFSDNNGEYVFDDDSDSCLDEPNLKKLKRDKQEIKLLSNGKDLDLQSDNEDDDIMGNSEPDFSEDDDDDLDPEDNSNSSQNNLKNKKEKSKAKKPKFKTIVDDQFFKVSELDEFLKINDLKEERKLDENDGSDDDDIDYFQDIPSEDSDEEDELENEIGNKKSSKDIMYEDFFDSPESGDESIKDEKEMLEEESEDNNDLEESLNAEDVEEEEEENDDDSENDVSLSDNLKSEKEAEPIAKTPFEQQQEKIQKLIKNQEEVSIQPADWQFTGEVAASDRPKDSLLQQDTDFDINAKPMVIEDNVTNEKIEKSIISLIKNKAYSDGQRQYKTNEDIIALKKEVVLDQAKSKKSLAAVYEEEYLKKKHGVQEQENPKHVEIKKMMDSLLPELQALFSHIPKPAVPDIKIVSNLPAITVEDVAPTSISDVTLLAPEEVKKKTGAVKGVTERTDTDRKRERRKKKMFQKNKFKKAETENAENPLSVKDKKLEKINTLKKLKQNRNTKVAEASGDKIKSSKDFFSRLQETVATKSQPMETKKKKRK